MREGGKSASEMFKESGLSEAVYKYISGIEDASAETLTYSQRLKLTTIALKEQAAAFLASPWGMATVAVVGIYAIAKAVEYFNGAADRARENLVESRNEYNNTVDEVNAAGLADLRVIDDSALKDWSGFADSTNHTTEEINALVEALEAAGMSAVDARNYASGNIALIADNFDSVLKPFLEDLEWSQEEIDNLQAKLLNMPVVAEDDANLNETTVTVLVDGKEIELAIDSVDQLEQALHDLPKDTTLTLIDDTGVARSGLATTKQLLEDIAANKYQSQSIGTAFRSELQKEHCSHEGATFLI